MTPDANGNYPTPVMAGATVNVNRVPTYQVFSLSGGYTFSSIGPVKGLQVYGVVDNLFDRDPPIAPGSGVLGNVNGSTNAVYFETLGRAFRVGVRTHF